MSLLPFSLLLPVVIAGIEPHRSAPPAGTWILQIEGDAAALAVTGATAKPFPFRAPRHSKSDYRVTLVDAKGVVVATAPLDLSKFCMNRGHRGRAAHVHHGILVEHRVVCTVKVPARADAVEVRIEDRRDARKPVVLGKVDRASLLALIAKEVKSRAEAQGRTETQNRKATRRKSETKVKGQAAPPEPGHDPKQRREVQP